VLQGAGPRHAKAQRVERRRWQMEDAGCTGGQVPDREPLMVWRVRGVRAGSMGSTQPRRELCKKFHGTYSGRVGTY